MTSSVFELSKRLQRSLDSNYNVSKNFPINVGEPECQQVTKRRLIEPCVREHQLICLAASSTLSNISEHPLLIGNFLKISLAFALKWAPGCCPRAQDAAYIPLALGIVAPGSRGKGHRRHVLAGVDVKWGPYSHNSTPSHCRSSTWWPCSKSSGSWRAPGSPQNSWR